MISREHAILQPQFSLEEEDEEAEISPEWKIIDTSNMNGLFVNHKKVQEAILRYFKSSLKLKIG